MEPMVIFGAGLVVYCGYLSLQDALRDWQRERGGKCAAGAKKASHAARRPAIFSAPGRGGAGVARWQAPSGGFV